MKRHRRTIAAVLLAGAVAAVLALVPFYGSLARSWERAQLRKELEGDEALEERVRGIVDNSDGRRRFLDLVDHELASSNVARRRRAVYLAYTAVRATSMQNPDATGSDPVFPSPRMRLAIHENDAEVCAWALAAMVKAREPAPEAVPALERLVASKHDSVRLNALRLLAISAPGAAETTRAFLQLSADQAGTNRAGLFEYLPEARLGHGVSARLVCAGLRDKAATVRDAAADALVDLDRGGLDPWILFGAIQGEEYVVRERLAHFLAVRKEKYLPVFAAGLREGEPAVRYWCARTLFRMGPDAGTPLATIEMALRSEERLARVWAVDCASMVEPAAARALLDALVDPDTEVRLKAARGLAARSVDRALAIPALAKALTDGHPPVRIAAAVSLLSLSGDHPAAVTELSARLEDPSGLHGRFALREVRRAGHGVAAIAGSLEKARSSPEEDIRSLAESAWPQVADGVRKDVEAPEEQGEDGGKLDAEEKAIAWLAREVPRWSVENRCRSCHNDGDGARALISARAASLEVPGDALEQALGWLSVPGEWIGKKAAEDPGGAELARLQFAFALAGAVSAGLLKERAPLLGAAEMLAKDQLPDGSWKGGSENPVGSPTAWSSHLSTAAARAVLAAAGTHDAERRRAESWLRDRKPESVHQAAVLLLAAEDEGGFPGEERIAESLALIRTGRSKDGGWGPYASSAPEAFDTALAILGLKRIERHLERSAALKENAADVREWILGGRELLRSSQYGDGSWLETTRPPGAESYAQRVSTTAWAALALIATR